MGNQRQKPAEQLQGKGSRYRGSASVTLMPLPPDAERETPPCPRGLTKAARAWYDAFWDDPISQVVTKAAWPKVQRLATLLAKREVVEKRIWAQPLVKGSMDQDVINPLLTLQKELSREIEHIENQIGLLPLAQMRLGIAIGQVQQAKQRGIRDRLDTPPEQPQRRVYRQGGA